MKVILLEDVKGVGKKGQLLDASEGHARNFLIPKKLAVEATKDNMNQLEQKRRSEEKKRQNDLLAAQEQKQRIEQKTIKIIVKSGESGRIFGSVTNKEIAQALEEQTEFKIDRKKILLDDPIKTKGEHSVNIKLHPEVTAKLNIEIE
ncbi:MAG: 50S ribosomal protein L9 [Clostridiales bacterium]|jgi:large subunit ribosomal protein L9|nr:50S ribosomal protein L9 [Clostridiales bacterium]